MFESVHSTGCVVPLLIAYFVPEGQQHSDVMMKGQEKMGLDYIIEGCETEYLYTYAQRYANYTGWIRIL